MAKNKIIGSNYVGPDGILCKDKVIKKAVAFVNSTSSASASRSARLSAAFDALTRFPYVRYMESTPGRAQMATIANQMFTRRGGNCYRYGAAFAYAATVLGYSSGTSTGMISAAGGGVTPHGWANVYINGYQYICDPDMAMAMGKSGFYMTSFAYYRVKPLITYNVYKMKVSKGKVIWS